MNSNLQITTTVAIILGLLTSLATVPSAAAQDDQPVVAAASAIVDSYHELGWFSGSVLLAKAGQPLYQRAVGGDGLSGIGVGLRNDQVETRPGRNTHLRTGRADILDQLDHPVHLAVGISVDHIGTQFGPLAVDQHFRTATGQ